MLREALRDSNSILHEIFDEKKLWSLANTDDEIITRPWFGQLMTQPQLIAYLYQFHLWYKDYRFLLLNKKRALADLANDLFIVEGRGG